MSVTDLNKPYSTALSIDTIPSFLLTWWRKASYYLTMYKKNLMNI